MRPAALPWANRRDAGRALARSLSHVSGQHDLLVLGLPRGGIPVAFEVAQALQAPLDVLVVRKLGLPGLEEYAMGAIASGGVRVMTPMQGMAVSPADLERVLAREQAELVRREQHYRGDRAPMPVRGRTVVVVDDGLATGASMRAAVLAIRRQRPARVVVAVPVGAPDSCLALRDVADEVVCPGMPTPFVAVGRWYRDFSQTSDEEVVGLLAQARRIQQQ